MMMKKMKMNSVDEATRIHFQEEIIMEILSRLPVRPLHRFKCVSKFWKALISDPYFKLKHLNHAKNDQKLQSFIFAQKRLDKDDVFNFYSSSLSSVQLVEDGEKLDCPSNYKPVIAKIYCCCDGLVLLGVNDNVSKHFLLWNPSTRESIVIAFPVNSREHCIYGLGYDATSDDYKILKIQLISELDDDDVSYEILAIKNGIWRDIVKYPSHIPHVDCLEGRGMDSVAFVHGSFHWLILSRYDRIVTLDISNEVYGEIPLPGRMRNIYKTSVIEHGVSVLEGMLCFSSTYTNYSGQGTFKLWVMKDYGVEESWTELLTIKDSDLFHSARPKYRHPDGGVLLLCGHYACIGKVYRLSSKGPFGLWPKCRTLTSGFLYTESLISPKSFI